MLGSNLRKVKRIKAPAEKNNGEMVVDDDDNVAKNKRAGPQEEEKSLTVKYKKIQYEDSDNLEGVIHPVNRIQNRQEGEYDPNNEEELSYEDDFDDEWEEEEIIDGEQFEEEKQEEFEEEEEAENDSTGRSDELTKEFSNLKFSDEPVVFLDDEPKFRNKSKKGTEEDGVKPFLGTEKNLKEGEVLDFDNRAYDLFHRARTPWPCLSLDVLVPKHKKGMQVTPSKVDIKQYPLTLYVVAGSQAASKGDNALYVMKWSRLHKTRFDDDSDILDEDDIDNYDEPRFDILAINHADSINRVRSMNGTGIVSLWDESGKVCIYDTSRHVQKLVEYNQDEEEIEDDEGPNPTPKGLQPPKDPLKRNFLINEFQHPSEGYAIQWSPLVQGLLATGSCDRRIHLYRPADENMSSWVIDSMPYTVHGGSIEDVQFSPRDVNIFASCSSDGTISFVDLRGQYKNECHSSIEVSSTDVNVLSWSDTDPNLIATGSDDGVIKLWDIRYIQKARSVAEIQFHTAAITSIEFQPFEDSVVTAASADNRVTVWDFSVESESGKQDSEVPDQLMFVHQGLEEVKEIKHHTYMSDLVLCTSANGFNIFKPNYEEEWDEESR